MKQNIISTGLDGTLLDETDVTNDKALQALILVEANNIPLIFCSSKTCPEIERYRTNLGNIHPSISKNGGGIFMPRGYFPHPIGATKSIDYNLILLGMPYLIIRELFMRIRNYLQTRILGFGDMSISEITSITRLSEVVAALAKQCDFDEVFIFEDKV